MVDSKIRVDLVSDTQSRPTPAMRKAIAEAPVGDEQRGNDPSTNRLCELVAELLGKKAAVFLPSGTMCNQVAILMHCGAGDEIIADESAHIITSEGAGAAALAGAWVRPLKGRGGIFTAEQLRAAVRPINRNAPRSRLVVVEQTSNRGGGTVWPLSTIEGVTGVANEHGLATHMDGARLMNAQVAAGIAAREFAAPFDSVWLDLSKGLGCPVGGVLASSAEFIDEAWRWKHRLGGAMRQSGILAAAGIYALEHHVERLAEDHANAKLFAERLAEIPGIELVPPTVETNLVFFSVEGTGQTAAQLSARLLERGVRIGEEGEFLMRAVTHLDVDRSGVETAAETLAKLIAKTHTTAIHPQAR
ncbi:MAG: threonine aldolase family protein [Acidiferrobacterales bacterium]